MNRFELNSPRVAAELLNAEALVIDFEAGTYFGLRGSAAAIWTLIEKHHDVASIVQHLEPHLSDAATLVPEFVRSLQARELIRSSDAAPERVDLTAFATPLSVPELAVFEDMQALLLLDPIHEVQPKAGWPFKIREE
jgi:hypothetical protein